jgi:hypothetical protein
MAVKQYGRHAGDKRVMPRKILARRRFGMAERLSRDANRVGYTPGSAPTVLRGGTVTPDFALALQTQL